MWAERLCGRREYCPYDLRLKLKARGVTPNEAERLIKMLVQHDFLNEERYVRAFIHDKSKLQGWGPQKIRFALCAKQIPDTLVREALEGVDADAQKETLRRLLTTKIRSLKADSLEDLRTKLMRFGLGRGFSYQDVTLEVSLLTKVKHDALTAAEHVGG